MNAPQIVLPGPGRRVFASIAAALLLAASAIVLLAQPAHAAARVDVSQSPNAGEPTTVTISGSGFQYQPNAPGGVYVFFGAVADPATNSWTPSQGGKSGTSFGYASTPGSTLLVAFQGGDSAEAANAMILPDGTWSAQMTIPGSSFSSSSGNPHEGEAVEGATIDCLRVQCGIITIGAHGMLNANNESFTPVGFRTASGEVRSGTGAQSFTDDATVLDLGADTQAGAPNEAAPAPTTEQSQANPRGSDTSETQVPAVTGSTIAVFSVLGGALLILLGTIVVVVVRRRRAGAEALSESIQQ